MHGPGRKALRIDVQVAQDVGREPFGIGLVVDREARLVTEALCIATQDADARRMECRHPHLLGNGPDQRRHARLHLVGGLVGEGDGEDLEGRDALLLDEPRDAVREHARLARSGARDDEKGTPGMSHCLTLDGVQVLEQWAGNRHPTSPYKRVVVVTLDI